MKKKKVRDMKEAINEKVVKATKWSTITEILAKLIVPITNLILARILAPEAFGILATVTMVTSFADMLTDAGFQKYIIQHEFYDDDTLYNSTNVAFITNFSFSVILWIVICIFRDQIASFLGNDGLGIAIAVSSIQIPIAALSSIQMALYKRKFDFKTLFFRRIISVLLPFFITIPLALLGLNYWALIIGTVSGQIVNAIILTLKSTWKPSLFFSFKLLKDMFSFSCWTLVDSIIVWLCSYVDVFILGRMFDSYHVGLYNQSLNMVNAIMNVVTSAITPVLLSGLSRYQDNDVEYNNLLFKFQRIMACLLIPMGVGIWLYRDFITNFILGSKWIEASNIIGIMSLIAPFSILLSNCTSICYISRGKPKCSILAQTIYLIPLIPLSIFFAKKGFWFYAYARNLFKIELIVVNLIILNYVIKIPVRKLISNLLKPILATIVMIVVSILLKLISQSIIWNFISILICIVVYFGVLFIIDKEDIMEIKKRILKKGGKKIEES